MYRGNIKNTFTYIKNTTAGGKNQPSVKGKDSEMRGKLNVKTVFG